MGKCASQWQEFDNENSGTAKPISSLIATPFLSCHAAYRRSQEDSTGNMKESSRNWKGWPNWWNNRARGTHQISGHISRHWSSGLPWSRSLFIRSITRHSGKWSNTLTSTSLYHCIMHWSLISSAWRMYTDNCQSIKRQTTAPCWSTRRNNSADFCWRWPCS
jgi:hypothetical protein